MKTPKAKPFPIIFNPTREQKRELVLNLTVRPKWRLADCIKIETK
jgi:hypothetical protein